VVVGMPGSGKTTVGRRLARVLGVDFLDTDQLIESDQGVSIPEIFAGRGEPYFREVEERIVADAVGSANGVVSLGGGAIISADTRRLLGPHTVVHLTIGVAEGARRSRGGNRPLLANSDVLAKYQELHTYRAPLYREVATVAVSTERRSTGKVVRDLVELLDPGLASSLDVDAEAQAAAEAASAAGTPEAAKDTLSASDPTAEPGATADR